jgi:sulfatase maturation enzyme AslB (radical SAM superfamily)
LIVEEKENLSNFEDFVERLYKAELTDLTILEDLSEYSMRYNEDEEEDLEVGNTSTFLNEYVDSIPEDNVKDIERKKVKKLLQVIYDEALNIDD